MINYRSNRSGLTGIELMLAAAIVGGIIWIFAPNFAAKMRDRKVAKLEQKIDKKKDEIKTQDNTQLAVAHQLVAGVGKALEAIPEDKRSPASELAKDLNRKADSALSAGRNQDLTPEQREAMADIVKQALSPLVEENAKANKSILDLTGKLNTSVAGEEKLRTENEALTGQRDAAVTDALAAAADNARLIFWLKIGLAGYAFVVWGLPMLAKFYPALAPIVRGSQWIVNQAGAASMSALTATVRGVEEARTRLSAIHTADAPSKEAADYAATKLDEAKAAVKSGLAEEIYDHDDARVQQIRREEAFV